MLKYKAVIYQEGMLGSLLLRQSKVNPVLNSAHFKCQCKRWLGNSNDGKRY